MIGQEKLLKKLNTYNIDTFPRSTILIGELGSGKHLISEYISKNVIKLPLLDITENINSEYIDEIYRNPNPSIYEINIDSMQEKEQNLLLKFIEEPLNNSFIILLCSNKNNILNTILNRCIIFELDFYSKDELLTFIPEADNKDLILNIIRTPGKLLSTNLKQIDVLYELCTKITTKLGKASYYNTLSIEDKVNFKDEYNKYDLDLFFDTLIHCFCEQYINNRNNDTLKLYLITVEYRKKLKDSRLNKQAFFENYLTRLWKEARI